MNLEKLCDEVREIVKATGKFIKEEATKLKQESIEVKGANNFVTHVDKASEEKLVAGLQKILPEAGFLVEEETISKKGEKYNWVIDPIDGTTNFIHGLPPHAISIGLLRDTKVVLGVILEIVSEECFYAWEGSKAYLDGKEIHVSNKKTVKDSLIATGFPYTDFHRIAPFFKTMEYFMHNSHGLRRLGSAAVDMAYVACGRFDAFYEYGLNPWDIAAGIIIIQQAGGKISDFQGGENFFYGRELIASNSYIFEEFKVIVGPMMQI
ncbi:MAG: inositol monophosphatase [Bacteroidales bacterium]|nr:inositol monophosphatase [Bacteroidales bacterium]